MSQPRPGVGKTALVVVAVQGALAGDAKCNGGSRGTGPRTGPSEVINLLPYHEQRTIKYGQTKGQTA